MNNAHLFTPFKLRDVTFKNRVGVSPMCQYSSMNGFATEWHLVHLGSRAIGGAGLVIAEATAVTADGRISPGDLGLWSDDHCEVLKRCTDFILEQGAVPGIQLAHAGRKGSIAPPWLGGHSVPITEGGWTPLWAPSPIPFAKNFQTPEALTQDQITSVVASFGAAARRAEKAGFKFLEIHAAHGYLLHQFLSPLSNQRTDDYGGSFKNRVRIVCEIVQAVRFDWPEHLPLGIRISATDWIPGGWNIEQSVDLIRILKPLGVDLVDCSSGGLLPGARIPLAPGYQIPFASRIRMDAEIPTATVGLITEPVQADEIIRGDRADMVFLGREMLRNPYWTLHAAQDLGITVKWPSQYERH